ncbi:succinate--CoA ligase subunit alpha [Candidatus Bathyarchaeota archaeon]|nr:succinate--CoA ligase subunit alpha [Candidatus Bathyarchaeota archaeon]
MKFQRGVGNTGILIDDSTRVLVQGITGFQGSLHTKFMLSYGTKIVAGVSPGKGGQKVQSIPVFNTVKEAQKKHSPNTSILFVPARFAAKAACEAIACGIKTIVIVTEHVPIRDTIQVIYYASKNGAIIVGPNSPGIITPKSCKLGIMPGHVFKSGNVGLISRSGTLTYEIAYSLSQKKIGQSTCIGIGGDPITGISFIECLNLFRDDSKTKAIVLIGEIGGNLEEVTADFLKNANFSKPIVAYIAGRAAPAEKRMGHAGAIIRGQTGTAEHKIRAFNNVGVQIAEKPSDVAILLRKILDK